MQRRRPAETTDIDLIEDVGNRDHSPRWIRLFANEAEEANKVNSNRVVPWTVSDTVLLGR
jgi:hypothetical protein